MRPTVKIGYILSFIIIGYLLFLFIAYYMKGDAGFGSIGGFLALLFRFNTFSLFILFGIGIYCMVKKDSRLHSIVFFGVISVYILFLLSIGDSY